jgi:hypothetical protein
VPGAVIIATEALAVKSPSTRLSLTFLMILRDAAVLHYLPFAAER